MMNTNTIILALALSLFANNALASRSAGSRGGPKSETTTLTEAQRAELARQARESKPGSVDQTTARQSRDIVNAREATIRSAYNGTLVSKSLTDVDALIALDAAFPLSRVAEILTKSVEAENIMLNRQRSRTAESPILRVTSKNLLLIDAIAKQVALGNPKYNTEAGKREVADLLEITEVELMNTNGWSVTRIRNLEVYQDVLIGGINRGLLPSEATALQTRFTWEELQQRCKRFGRRV